MDGQNDQQQADTSASGKKENTGRRNNQPYRGKKKPYGGSGHGGGPTKDPYETYVPEDLGELVPSRDIIYYKINYSAYLSLVSRVHAYIRLNLNTIQNQSFAAADFTRYCFSLLIKRLQDIAIACNYFHGVEEHVAISIIPGPIGIALNTIGEILVHGKVYRPVYNAHVRKEIKVFVETVCGMGQNIFTDGLSSPNNMIKQNDPANLPANRAFVEMLKMRCGWTSDDLFANNGANIAGLALAVLGTLVSKGIAMPNNPAAAVQSLLQTLAIRVVNGRHEFDCANQNQAQTLLPAINAMHFGDVFFTGNIAFFAYIVNEPDITVQNQDMFSVLEHVSSRINHRRELPSYGTGHYGIMSCIRYNRGTASMTSPMKLSNRDVGIAAVTNMMSYISSARLTDGYVLAKFNRGQVAIVQPFVDKNLRVK